MVDQTVYGPGGPPSAHPVPVPRKLQEELESLHALMERSYHLEPGHVFIRSVEHAEALFGKGCVSPELRAALEERKPAPAPTQKDAVITEALRIAQEEARASLAALKARYSGRRAVRAELESGRKKTIANATIRDHVVVGFTPNRHARRAAEARVRKLARKGRSRGRCH